VTSDASRRPADTPPRSAVALLRSLGLTAKKHFGQNFLLDRELCKRIAAAAVPPGGTVLEIGPGLGALTEPLLELAGRVIAVERDRDLVSALRQQPWLSQAGARVQLLEGDALSFDWRELLATGPEPRSLVGNLPYLLTGRFLERAMQIADAVTRAVFMVQLEVAERLMASPGSKIYGALTVFARAQFTIERLLVVRAGAFHPRPEVDSAVIVLSPLAVRQPETELFRALVRGAFGTRRKTLRNAWKGMAGDVEASATAAGIDLGRRGETLSVAEFAAMARELAARAGGVSA